LKEVRQQNPTDTRTLYLLAQAQHGAGQLEEAENTARQLMAMAPGSTSGAYTLAQVYDAKQQYRRVVETLEPMVTKAGAKSAEAVPLVLMLASAHEELGEFDLALTAFERARKIAPDNDAIDLYELGTLVSAKRFDQAVERSRVLMARHPGDQRVVRLRVGGRPRLRSVPRQLDELLERQHLAPEVGVAIGDGQPGARDVDDLLLLGEGQPRVERHARDACPGTREVERDRERPVPDEQGDGTAGAAEQDMRHPRRQPVHLAEGERLVTAEDGRTVAMAPRAAADQLGRRHHRHDDDPAGRVAGAVVSARTTAGRRRRARRCEARPSPRRSSGGTRTG
jgi:tetratricopeptide (TPR) repeat protein